MRTKKAGGQTNTCINTHPFGIMVVKVKQTLWKLCPQIERRFLDNGHEMRGKGKENQKHYAKNDVANGKSDHNMRKQKH